MRPLSRRAWLRLALGGALALGTGAAGPAFAGPAPIPWARLGPREREVLARHRRAWAGYPPARQRELLEGARRWLSLSPEERARLERARRRYQHLSPEERRRLRESYRRGRP